MLKRVIKYAGLLLLGLLIALVLVPFLFKDEIIEQIELYANENINADLNFEDVSLSLIKSFPNASVSIHDISITGKDEFESQQLFTASEIQVETNLKTVWSSDGNVNIKEVHLFDPTINLIVNKEGNANFDIVKATESSDVGSSQEVTIALQKYSINNANISYQDNVGQMSFAAKEFNQVGNGDFTAEIFTLSTNNDIASTTLNVGGVPYLNKAKIEGPLDLEVNLSESKYTLKDNDIKIHDLALAAIGYVDINDNDMDLDFDIKSKKGDIRNFLSLIPNVYYQDLPAFEAKGTALLDVQLKGKYSDNSFPAINLKLNADNGYLNSSDLPQAISDLSFDVNANAKAGNWNDLRIDIPNFSLQTMGEPFKGKLLLENVMLDPHLDLDAQGKLDLGSIAKFINVEELDIKSGKLETDFQLDAKQSDLESENYEAISFSGVCRLNKFEADYGSYEDIKIDLVDANLSPKLIKLENLSGSLGSSDFAGNLILENPLSYLLTNEKMKASIDLRSKLLDLSPYLSETTEDTEDGTAESFDDSSIRAIDLAYDIDVKEIKYPDYKLENFRSKGIISSEDIKIAPSSIVLNDQQIQFDATLSNAYDYYANDGTLSGEINFIGGKIDLDAFTSGEESTEKGEATEAFILPKNIKTTLTGKFDELTYGEYAFNDLKGKLNIQDGIAQFDGIAGSVLDGYLKMDGIYDSSDPSAAPNFDMKYDLSKLQWSKTFAAVETFRKLAPIGKFIDGIFNSTLTFTGELKDDMYPNWGNLSAAGFIHTLDGEVNGFLPIQKLGDQLGIKALKNFKIQNTKNWFELKDGFVEIKPFDFEIEDMKFTAGGKHSLEQNLDYVIKAVIPRERLKKGQVGQVADQGLEYLLKEAGKKGVKLDVGDFIYMDIGITGTIKNPKIKVVPKGSGGQSAKDIVDNKIEEVKETIRDTINKEVDKQVDRAKDTIMSEADKVVDKAKDVVEEETDKAIEKGKEVIVDKVGTVVDSAVGGILADTLASKVGDKVDDILNDQSKEEIDKLKDKLKDWDPFKKKKKGGGN